MRLALIFLLLTFLAGCTNIIYSHGVLEKGVELFAKIKLNDSKGKVLDVLGLPTLISKFNENTWYYISYKTRQFSLFGKRKYSSKSLQISFDYNDRVVDIREVNIPERSLVTVSEN